jgi:hypothetical protein
MAQQSNIRIVDPRAGFIRRDLLGKLGRTTTSCLSENAQMNK